MEQGLLLLGWVVNWKPIEILLYDRLSTKRRLRLYGRLADVVVEVSTP